MNRPNMVPSGVVWHSTGHRRVILVHDAEETAGAQMAPLIAYCLNANLSMCMLGTPMARQYHSPFIAQMLYFPPEWNAEATAQSMLDCHTLVDESKASCYSELYRSLTQNMCKALGVKAACQVYTEDEALLTAVLVDACYELTGFPPHDFNIGFVPINWPHDESVTYVLAQSNTESYFIGNPAHGLLYNNAAKLAWSRAGSDRTVL